MHKIWKLIFMLTVAVLLLSGCDMSTVDQLYQVPERSKEYEQLQTAINTAMTGKEYSAPRSGENQQTVQLADLTGDGLVEYIVFTKSADEHPLQVLIFTREQDGFVLLDVVKSYGTAFDQVEYVNMDDKPGYELVVGSRLADSFISSVAVYCFSDGQTHQLMSTGYSEFVPCDLNLDGIAELVVLRPGETGDGKGVAEFYTHISGYMGRSVEVSMSESVDEVKRVLQGTLNDGTPAVYVASTVDANAIITDVFAIVDGTFTNVTFSNESGTSVQTLRNYYVYADDIDKDGVIELPDLIPMTSYESASFVQDQQQHLIRWYSMDSDGSEVDKLFTYHNFVGGWYLVLNEDYLEDIYVIQNGIASELYIYERGSTQGTKILSVYALTGQNREEQAQGRQILYRGDSVIYAAELTLAPEYMEEASQALMKNFHLIHQSWKTGET